MNRERWQHVQELFHAALQYEPQSRSGFLVRACAGDDELRAEVESLLEAHERAGSLMTISGSDKLAKSVNDQDRSSLRAGQTFGHYRILSTIGGGGMGEIFLAQDLKLSCKVALKILPTQVAGELNRVGRFVREAQAAAALNHPNIAHIKEIDEINGTHYIAMEYVDGVTLRQQIASREIPPKRLIEYLIQVAEGLLKAHESGIVHRDLKPENIMISRDGYAKILDFGLAKLVSPNEPVKAGSETIAGATTVKFPLERDFVTGTVIIGTVGYMSPEQARGLTNEIDHRSDIFSFGCLLFEAATREKAFPGEGFDALFKIISGSTPEVGAYIANDPGNLQRIVSRCLAKDKNDRYQSIKEVAIELRELCRSMESQFITMPVTPSDELRTAKLSDPGGVVQPPIQTKSFPHFLVELRKRKPQALIAVLMLIIAGGAYVAWKYRQSKNLVPKDRASYSGSFQSLEYLKVTSTGSVTDTAISPDGIYAVYVAVNSERQSLWLRHIPTGTDREIVPPAELKYRGLIFSHDGSYIYFIGAGNERANDGLYRVGLLGGDRRKVAENIGSSASNITMVNVLAISPDNRSLAYARRPNGQGESALVIINMDGTQERTIVSRRFPERVGDPGWSPDGKTLAYSVATISAGYSFTLFAINLEDGKEIPLGKRWWNAGRVVWANDGSGFFLTASDQPFGPSQVWFVSYPDGKTQRVTNDPNQYEKVSLTADSSTLLAIKKDYDVKLCVTEAKHPRKTRQILSGDPSLANAGWTADGRIVFESSASNKHAIWLVDADGSNKQKINDDTDAVIAPVPSPDGRYIVFAAYHHGVFNIWRTDSKGDNLKQLTDDNGNFPVISPDSKWVVYFVLRPNGGGQIRRVSIDGGTSTAITPDNVNAISPHISPDGTMIACGYVDLQSPATSPGLYMTAIIPFTGGPPIKTFNLLGGPENPFGWTADSGALTYLVKRNGISNIWEQPLDGKPPRQISDSESEEIFSYSWSGDGQRLVLVEGKERSDVVMIRLPSMVSQ